MINKILTISFVLIFALTLVSAHGEVNEYYNDHHGMMSGVYGMWGMGVIGWLIVILIVVVLILLIIWLIKQLNEPRRGR